MFLKVKHANVPLDDRNIYLKYQGVLQVNNLGKRLTNFKTDKTKMFLKLNMQMCH